MNAVNVLPKGNNICVAAAATAPTAHYTASSRQHCAGKWGARYRNWQSQIWRSQKQPLPTYFPCISCKVFVAATTEFCNKRSMSKSLLNVFDLVDV